MSVSNPETGPSSATADWLAPRLGTAVVEVAGGDAWRFLQAQLTADVREAGAGRAQPAALCNADGRVVAVLTLVARDDGCLLLAPLAAAADLVAHLRRHVLRADVRVADAEDRLAVAGAAGDGAAAHLAALLGACPRREHEAWSCAESGLTVARAAGARARFLLAGPPARLDAVSAELSARGVPRGEPARWTLLDIRAGVPAVSGPNRERYLPQMLGLDALGAVSFTKGCYLGQEAVATLQHRGRLPRGLRRLRTAGPPPAPGTVVYGPGGPDGAPREEGRTLQAASDGAAGSELLAVVRREAPADGLRLGAAGGPSLAPLPLPEIDADPHAA